VSGKLNKVEAAAFLEISVKTLNNWISQKRRGLRRIRYAGRVYFDKKDLEAFKRSQIETIAS
jgi:hypothetical protein